MPTENVVTLRPSGGRPQQVPFGLALQQAAREWTYRVRNRARWTEPGRPGSLPQDACRRALADLGIDWKAFTGSSVLEISIPYREESEGWEARVFPWEFVLMSAVEPGSTDIEVIRTLKRRKLPSAASDGPVLIIDSAPPGARDLRDLDSECRLVEGFVRERVVVRLSDPTRTQIRKHAAQLQPAVIHVTGLDSHEAEAFGYLEPRQRRNGYYLEGETIDALDLAELLTVAGKKPQLVVFNVSHSASRIAALSVAAGAQSALGFQDEVDGDAALLLLSNLYDGLTRQELSPSAAFRMARKAAENSPHSGSVFWTSAPTAPVSLPSSASVHAESPLRPQDLNPDGLSLRELVNVAVRPLPELNYSLLHNDRDLFETFLIERRTSQPIHGVTIEVTVFAGSVPQPFVASIDLENRVTDVKPLVRIPLVDTLSRSAVESLRTLLHISVSWEGIDIHRSSWFVTLLPPDEWTDDPTGWPLLPSFVLSRDHAVTGIVEKAGRFLRFLEDDAGAGFTGYEPLPGGVDRQVQALWTTLSFEEGLSYMAPPPVFSTARQRIRTPSQIMRVRSGTCLDLALLFAGCLEAVDIYPVLFLFKGHAFPGYWRSIEAHDEFRRNPWATAGMAGSGGAEGPREAAFLEVQTRVFQQDLVPLETVGLTRRASFAEGLRQGLENMASLSGFEGLVDVRLSRLRGVLPLPILEKGS